ncbi:MAG: permease-like cell division protein FtsX, partial [Desulfuromonadaceae bacterium]
MERLSYFFRRALRNMRQCPFLCSVAVGITAVALTIVAFFALVVLNIQQLTAHWSGQVEIVAYLEPAPAAGDLPALQGKIGSFQEVEAVRYVSRKEARDRFRQRLGDDADLLDGVDPDILPASLEVALKPAYRTRAGVEQVVARLKRETGLQDLRFGREWLEKFETFVVLLKLIGA